MAVITTEKLTKYYGRTRGIAEIDLTVEEGEFFGFIGPNGAGKTTTIRTLLNFIFPTSGRAEIFRMDCARKSAEIKKDIGYVPGEVRYYTGMKAGELLDYCASLRKNVDRKRMLRLCDIFEVESGKRIGELSLGNLKKVAIVQALQHRPKLLLLDEPASGLDPLMQTRLFEILKEENSRGTTIFLSSHNLAEVQRHCLRVAFLREGRIIEDRKIHELAGLNACRVRISAEGDIAAALGSLGVHEFEETTGYKEFIYNGSIDALIKAIAGLKVKDLRIENIQLEDAFMHYYEKE
ncbi:MAG: ABC transporter ATP-binding protein [Bacillota bacterium]|nr:ABC transporter ATP-binding protein [Bacillota bacterium]